MLDEGVMGGDAGVGGGAASRAVCDVSVSPSRRESDAADRSGVRCQKPGHRGADLPALQE